MSQNLFAGILINEFKQKWLTYLVVMIGY